MLRASEKRRYVGRLLPGIIGSQPRIFDPVVLNRYDNEVLADSPVAYWRMDSRGGAVFDLSGSNRDSVPQSSVLPTYRASAVAGAPFVYGMTFAGTTDQLILQTTPTTASDNFTVESWIRFDDLSGTDYRWVFRCGPSSLRGWGVGVLRNGDQMAWVANNAGIGQGGSALTQGTWYHLVWQRDAGTWKSYINGASNSANMGTTAPTAPLSSDLAYIAGESGGSGQGAVATIASLAIYNSVLSSGRVSAHYA